VSNYPIITVEYIIGENEWKRLRAIFCSSSGGSGKDLDTTKSTNNTILRVSSWSCLLPYFCHDDDG